MRVNLCSLPLQCPAGESKGVLNWFQNLHVYMFGEILPVMLETEIKYESGHRYVTAGNKRLCYY